MRLLSRFVLFVATVLTLVHIRADAQPYPVKPIRFVTGGGPDAMARILGPKITEAWGQQVVIEERSGGGGMLSAETVARASADGYTLLLATGTHTISPNFFKLSYDMTRDFAPVTLLGTIPFALAVQPSLPVKSVDDLIRIARAKPGELNYGSGGNGSPGHLIGEMFKSRTGINLVHVPYKTVAAGVTALIGDQVQVMFVVAPSAVPQIKAGRIRPLAVSTLQRTRSLPDVPTIAESGLPGFSAPIRYGLAAPPGTSPAIVERLSRELDAVLRSDEVRDKFAEQGAVPGSGSPAAFASFVAREEERYARIVKAANIRE